MCYLSCADKRLQGERSSAFNISITSHVHTEWHRRFDLILPCSSSKWFASSIVLNWSSVLCMMNGIQIQFRETRGLDSVHHPLRGFCASLWVSGYSGHSFWHWNECVRVLISNSNAKETQCTKTADMTELFLQLHINIHNMWAFYIYCILITVLKQYST